MKLLVVTSFFPLSSKDKVPQFLLEQVRALAVLYPESQIVVLTTSRNGEEGRVADNVVVKRFSYFWPIRKQNLTTMGILPALKKSKWNLFMVPLLFIFEYLAIVKETKKFNPDYIYSHWFLPQGLLCHWVAKRFRIKHVFTSHSYDVEICKKVPLFGPALVRSAISSMKAVTVVSQRTLKGISHFYNQDEWEKISQKFKVLPMGVDLPSNIEPTNSMQIKKMHGLGDKKVIFFMGRFVAKKGIDILLQAFSELLKIDSTVVLVLAGDGVMKPEIHKWIAELGLEGHVLLPGFITEKEKESFLLVSDMYVLPSIEAQGGDREGLPVSLLESMSYGRVCIATTGSGAEEVIVSGENGFLCPSGAPDLLLDKMITILNLNKARRDEIERRALDTAHGYSWPNIILTQSEHFFDK